MSQPPSGTGNSLRTGCFLSPVEIEVMTISYPPELDVPDSIKFEPSTTPRNLRFHHISEYGGGSTEPAISGSPLALLVFLSRALLTGSSRHLPPSFHPFPASSKNRARFVQRCLTSSRAGAWHTPLSRARTSTRLRWHSTTDRARPIFEAFARLCLVLTGPI